MQKALFVEFTKLDLLVQSPKLSFIKEFSFLKSIMEIKVLEEKGNRFVFQLIGADHTFCNALKKELVNVPNVDLATYAIEHPQIGIPKFLVEVKKGSPRDALLKAADAVEKANKEFVAAFKKLVK